MIKQQHQSENMKTITIKLTLVEAAMLAELQKVKKEYSDLNKLMKALIHDRYDRLRR